jgi:probable H4MPT-linked C1 transfer pathway protein
MSNSYTLGWDIGGAHVKAVLTDALGQVSAAFQQPCPLWRGIDQLIPAVHSILHSLPAMPDRHALTMTGELADIFPDRRAGVVQISDAMQQLLGEAALQIYAGSQGFVSHTEAMAHANAIASANWHASAAYLASQVEEGMLVDIGSTTADLILLHKGKPAMIGYTDAERMQSDELVYTGVVRTPVMAVAGQVSFAGGWQRLAAEHFATMADVYRLTGELAEGGDMGDTADGMGKSLEDSARRLARMVGCDLGDAPMQAWRQLASSLRSEQLRTLHRAIERQLSRGLLSEAAPIIGAGAGRFLAAELARWMGRPYVDAEHWIRGEAATAAWAGTCFPAYAVACLCAGEAA